MENNTLILNTMKAKVKSNPKDWATYTFLVMLAVVILYVALSART